MLEEEARVVSASGDTARVHIKPNSACGSCNAKGACGTSLVASLFPTRNATFTVQNPVGAMPGQDVIVGLDEDVLQRASVIVYLLPILGLILGAALGVWLADRYFSLSAEPVSIVSGLSGMAVTFILVNRFSKTTGRNKQYQARIVRIKKQNNSWNLMEKT